MTTPLRYIHIGGHGHSGSTLLKNLMGCFKNTYVSPQERSRKVFNDPRGDGKIVITKSGHALKQPDFLDLPNTHFLYSMRNPKDIACSKFWDPEGEGKEESELMKLTSDAQENDYLGWRELKDFLEEYGDRVLVVRYEDVIRNPDETQEIIAEYCNLEIDIPFADAYKQRIGDQEFKEMIDKAMHSIRPLDDRSIGRWKQDKFRPYVEEWAAAPVIQWYLDKFYPELGD